MKLTCVTAVFNAIKSGNRENLIRCVRSVAVLKTEHEHLIYDGGSTDGTVELLRELETEINNSTVPLFSTPIFSHPRLRVVSEPDTGIYNALNKGVRDAQGEWFYVLGCDDYISAPEVMDEIIGSIGRNVDMVVSPVDWGTKGASYKSIKELKWALLGQMNCHQGVLVRTKLVRSFSGFDESFKMCADVDLVLKVHQYSGRTQFRTKPFTHYGACGFSSTNDALFEEESSRIARQHFKFDPNVGEFNLLSVLRYSCHRDFYIRNSARHMLYQWSRKVLRKPLYPLVVLTRPLRYR